MKMRSWVNWVNVILGVWLMASPWLFTAAGGDAPAAWNSWSVGTGIVILAFVAMYRPAVWGGAIGIMLGTWLVISPWLLGFDRAVAANAVVIGVLVIGYALWGMGIDHADSLTNDHDAIRAGSKRSHSGLSTA